MHTRLPACGSFLRGDHHARQLFIRRIIGLVAILVFSATVLPIVRSSTLQSAFPGGEIAQQTPSTNRKQSSRDAPKYDCVGSLDEHESTKRKGSISRRPSTMRWRYSARVNRVADCFTKRILI